jgi:hypothetical protein
MLLYKLEKKKKKEEEEEEEEAFNMAGAIVC